MYFNLLWFVSFIVSKPCHPDSDRQIDSQSSGKWSETEVIHLDRQ